MGAKAYTINKGNCKPADRNGTLEKATKIYTNLMGNKMTQHETISTIIILDNNVF